MRKVKDPANQLIKISVKNKKTLDILKLYKKEPYNSVLVRLLEAREAYMKTALKR
jgi:hypothetical protein